MKNDMIVSAYNTRHKVALAALMVLAATLYCLFSIVNHCLFRTYALDLGFYNYALYNYSHFSFAPCGMFKNPPAYFLSDHFDLYLLFFSPLVWLFGSYTLLIVQILAVLFGGWGVYKLVGLYSDDKLMSLLAAATLLFSFGVIQPLAYDYHSNVVSAMLLPWLFYFIKRQRYGLSSLFVVLMAIGKENISLWLFFICVGLMWEYRKDRVAIWHLVAYAVFSAAYFFIVNMVVMPELGGSGGGMWRYAYLGDSFLDKAENLLLNPLYGLGLLFANVENDPACDGLKAEFYYCALASGLLLTLLKPNYLFMLIPLLAQKMLAYDPVFWGIGYHYNVEFVPILVIASFIVITWLKKRQWRLLLSAALLVSTVCASFYTTQEPKTYLRKEQVNVFCKEHYEQNKFDVDFARSLVSWVPKDAAVCASSQMSPRLALRPKIYDFSRWQWLSDAEYYVLLKSDMELEADGQPVIPEGYAIVATDGNLYLVNQKRELP